MSQPAHLREEVQPRIPPVAPRLVAIMTWMLRRAPVPERRQAAKSRRSRIERLERRTLLEGATRFAVIGDYGDDDNQELAVSNLVKSWSPEFIVTTGDNNYPDGEAATIDDNIGQYYHEFIGNYQGSYGPGSAINRFFPAIGNHDWETRINGLPQPYLDYFTLPGNELYYEFTWGPVQFFIIDAYANTPDGATAGSVQGQWLQAQLASSTAPWKVVVMHNAPYSSGRVHGNEPRMQWPYAAWGADAVLAGHEHTYERLHVDGITYFVNGLGGRSRYAFETIVPQSRARYNSEYGAMLAEADAQSLTFSFYSVNAGGELVDSYRLQHFDSQVTSLVPEGDSWKFLDNGSNQGTAWRTPGFNDSGWASGPAELGYGQGDEATVVSFGGNSSNRHETTYFRRAFHVADPQQFNELALQIVRDDGAVVYLNGHEVLRHSLPAGAVAFDTLANFAADLGEDDAWLQVYVDPGLLVPGTNVLAVEIHQQAVNSSDLSFNLQLDGLSGQPATIAGRRIYYNNSAFDGNNAAANAADDGAIATDKSALLPGGTATFANYTSFSKGITGLMVDVMGLAGVPTAADFAFKTGNNNAVGSWTTLATAPTITVRPGAGTGGSDRVSLTWPDGTITKRWLQVTMLPTANTGLPSADVFYFGNAVGESGDTTTNAAVNATDEIGARANPRSALVNPAPVDFRWDYNRDKAVNSTDQLIARTNTTTLANRLVLIAPPAGGGGGGGAGGAADLADAAALADPADSWLDALASARTRRRR
jgi:hypothetical protein